MTHALNDYQEAAVSIAIYPGQGSMAGLVYCALKLNGEAGEVAEKVGKALRDHEGEINLERRSALILELGDVLWYVAAAARELHISLEAVAERNLEKLRDRRNRGALSGSGDNR